MYQFGGASRELNTTVEQHISSEATMGIGNRKGDTGIAFGQTVPQRFLPARAHAPTQRCVGGEINEGKGLSE